MAELCPVTEALLSEPLQLHAPPLSGGSLTRRGTLACSIIAPAAAAEAYSAAQHPARLRAVAVRRTLSAPPRCAGPPHGGAGAVPQPGRGPCPGGVSRPVLVHAGAAPERLPDRPARAGRACRPRPHRGPRARRDPGARGSRVSRPGGGLGLDPQADAGWTAPQTRAVHVRGGV